MPACAVTICFMPYCACIRMNGYVRKTAVRVVRTENTLHTYMRRISLPGKKKKSLSCLFSVYMLPIPHRKNGSFLFSLEPTWCANTPHLALTYQAGAGISGKTWIDLLTLTGSSCTSFFLWNKRRPLLKHVFSSETIGEAQRAATSLIFGVTTPEPGIVRSKVRDDCHLLGGISTMLFFFFSFFFFQVLVRCCALCRRHPLQRTSPGHSF